MKRFYKNDQGYEDWCKYNPNGFVFNNFGGNLKNSNMNKIHNSNCAYLWRKIDRERRTTTYEKICSTDLKEIICFVNKERGTDWSYCNRCFPNK